MAKRDKTPRDKTKINSATLAELTSLPGSNRFLAMRILGRREHEGPFEDFTQLERIRGVSRSLIEKWTDVAVIGAADETPELAAAAQILDAVGAGRRAGEREPVVFAGYSQLHAVIPVERLELTERQVARFALADIKLNGRSGQPLDHVLFSPFPGRPQSVAATVEIDPLTPPGRYEGELTAGRKRYPAVFIVGERCAFKLIPHRFCICDPPGTEVTRHVLMLNLGNTSMTMSEGHVVALLQDVFWCRKGREAVKNPRLDKDDLTWDEVVTVAVHELRDAFREEPPLRLRVLNAPLSIAAGRSQEVAVAFTVPTQLRPNRRYRGIVRLFNTTLSLEFYHTFGETTPADLQEEPVASKPTPRARKTSTRQRARKKRAASKVANTETAAV